MKNKKKMIIYSIIGLLIIILIVSILLIKALKEEDNKYDEILESKEGIMSEDEDPVSLIRTNNAITYYTVDECLKSYFRMLEIEDRSVLMAYLVFTVTVGLIICQIDNVPFVSLSLCLRW